MDTWSQQPEKKKRDTEEMIYNWAKKNYFSKMNES